MADQWRGPSCESNQTPVINNEWHNQQGRRAPLCEAAEWEPSSEGRGIVRCRAAQPEKMIRRTTTTPASLTQWQEVDVWSAGQLLPNIVCLKWRKRMFVRCIDIEVYRKKVSWKNFSIYTSVDVTCRRHMTSSLQVNVARYVCVLTFVSI